jgi:hypothetical protein
MSFKNNENNNEEKIENELSNEIKNNINENKIEDQSIAERNKIVDDFMNDMDNNIKNNEWNDDEEDEFDKAENEYKKKKEEAQKQNYLNYDYNIRNKFEDEICNNEEIIDEDNYFGNNVGKIFNEGNFNNFHFNNEIDEEKGIYNHFLQNRYKIRNY